MPNTALETFIANTRADWGPLTSKLVDQCRGHLEQLTRAPSSEAWLIALHRDGPVDDELYRDPDHGFVLLAHTERAGLYRPPHDHGRSWVIYALQDGEIEMGSYARIEDPQDGVRLVKRDSTRVRAGQALVYLPGDIHDTRCLTDTALLFRFTERDLRIEDRQEGRVTRYQQRNGVWTTGDE